MSGFVASAAATLAERSIPDADPTCVMGYYDAADLPVYDHLAEEFAICDRWFPRWPAPRYPTVCTRLCGVAAGSRDDRAAHIPPLYHQPSFVRHLDAHHVLLAVVLLRSRHAAPRRCPLPARTPRSVRLLQQDRPSVADHPRPHRQPEDVQLPRGHPTGTLPAVSWIDPAFTNFNPLGFPVNDDHPPADVKDGQDLVLAVYDALAASPQWDRSLLVIVYDEHGGFYDHVPPPPAADDEPEMFGRYGVRVPAIIVSPWIEPRTVSQHPVRPHLDHQDDPAAILPRGPAIAAARGEARRDRLGLGPQYPGRACPGQPSRGTADPRHATSRPAADALLRQAAARPAPARARPAQPGPALQR